MGLFSKLKPGKYTNRKGKEYEVTDNGRLVRHRNHFSEDFFASPHVQRQLDGVHRLFMQQTLIALHEGKRPPHSVGGYGTLTKKKLIVEWNDDWQKELDKMSEYYDVTYNSFFGIPEEHPPVGILLTADEIVEQYGSKEESEES